MSLVFDILLKGFHYGNLLGKILRSLNFKIHYFLEHFQIQMSYYLPYILVIA